ncbi:mucin-17 isoform X2 [Drosophila biarmipes]|uniref:mucin-17 isoform X2 n=1 Tax=Drosophila biarmipes TaxID=125945 RepID=UPI0007E7B68A|nr:mucin-17 isoform X2 [Drosophila biarmipes]
MREETIFFLFPIRVAAPPPAGAGTSAASATSQPASTKKEKHQRSKQADKEKDKDKEEKQASSGKRKKEKISVEKIDTGDFVVGIGDKLKVNYHEKKSPSSHGSTYEAKVIEISVQRGVPMYLVHYTGWNNRYDEWVPRERIAENLTKGSKQKTRTISTSSANSGSGGGGGGSLSVQGSQPPGVADKLQTGKDGFSKMPPSAGNSSGPGAPLPSGSLGGASSTPSLLSTVVKTPTTGGAKRGRGRSDSMPPRSTTPSSVVPHSARTKSPAASQTQLQPQMKKRPTRVVPGTTTPRRVSDASMASESDSDSDEPVRRPKRQSAKEKPQTGKAQQPGKGRVASRASSTAPAPHPSDDSEEDEEDDEPAAARAAPSKQQQQQAASVRGSRAGGNRAMSSGAASAKGRDYDLSEIRSELKGFQPKLLTNSATNEDRKDIAKQESSAEPALQDIKKEPKQESSAKSSSTELSSETESYVDEDSQSSDYRKQPKGAGAGKKESMSSTSKSHHEPVTKRELAVKEEPLKIEPKTEPKDEEPKTKPFLSGADIKPTALIAPARFGNASAPQAASSSVPGSSTAKYTSVIVEKHLTIGGKKSSEQHVPKKLDQVKKQSGGAAATASGSSLSGQESKKFAEPVANLKVEMPAACSPSSSSSSSSSLCSTGSAASSSSATRSLPDMSKLEISSGTAPGPTATAAASQPGNAAPPSSSGAAKESKYSSSGGTATGLGLSIRKLLSSDVYEFKDTEPFEFEKRISPMASVGGTVAAGATGGGAVVGAGASVITAVMPTPGASGSGGTASASTSAAAVVSSAARKQALKASAMLQSLEQHQLPPAGHERSYNPMTTAITGLTAPKLKKRGSPLKEPALSLEKPKIYKQDKDQVQQPPEQKAQQLTPSTLKVLQPIGQVSPATSNPVKMHTPPGSAAHAASGASLNTPTSSSGQALLSASSTPSQLAPHHATPFDALRKSPSFNLNITALNEELAQTVQETTRALTDALQPPTTPGPPSLPTSVSIPAPVTPVITPTPTAVLSCPSTPPTGASAVLASPKLSTPPQSSNANKPPAPHIVGSPFIETRNVFELSTSNEGSGYSSGESKDNKLEKLENVKILLAGAAGPFDLDAGSYEQKPSSIADKVLKAISQKKEEVENNKSKPQAEPIAAAKTSGSEEVVPTPPAKLELCSSAIKLDTLKLLSEPLKIQTGPLLGELYRPGPATSSPETKSILESSLPAKNSELSETIQKLECAIQQRKTPVGGALSLASSTAGTPPAAHTPNSTATAGAGFSDESMDSTDSEQRLVIEDVIAEEHTTTTTTGEQKSPGSGQEEGQTTTATMVTTVTVETEGTSSSTPTPPVPAPVKLEVSAKALPGIQAPIPLKPSEGSSFAGKLAAVTRPPPLAKLQQQEEVGQAKNISSFGIPIVLPEIPASVVVATPALMVASAAMRQSPGSTPSSPVPVLMSPFLSAPKEPGGLLLKAYTAAGGAVTAAGGLPSAGSVIAAAGGGPPTVISNFPQQHQQSGSVLPAAPEIPASYILDAEMAEAPNSSATVVARPFVMHAVGKELFNVVAPAASSPLISDPHNESINLLCEETIPGSPAPNYGGSEQLPAAVGSALAIMGITPLPPETPPPEAVAAIQPQQQPQVQTGQQAQAAKTVEVIPSAPNSSPDSASQDESGEETKKSADHGHEDSSGLETLNKRKRTRKQLPMSAQTTAAVAAQLQSLGKRRRQVSGMRSQKTTATTAGSDTDDNSDNIAPTVGQQHQQQRQSARQQMLPQGNAQPQQQQPLLQQQQASVQQGIQAGNTPGVRPCPYNFLVELDPALSSDECITILRKQIQDLRKAYNTIKGELTVIDRRRKKLRRREREKKQQQLQSQQQGKICA